MNWYIITYIDLAQIEVRVDTINEALQVAQQVTEAEVIKIERVLGT